MKPISTVSMFALSASLVLFSTNVMAAKTVNAGITDLTYTLIDLDANDGITPYLQFYSISAGSSASISSTVGDDSSSASGSRSVHSWKDYQTSISNEDGSSKAAAGMFGRTLFAGGNLADGGYGNLLVDQRLGASFLLSPHTKLVFSGTLAGVAISSAPYGAWSDLARSSTEISLSGDYSRVSASGSASVSYGGNDEQYYESDFALSLVNRANAASYGQIDIHNYASAQDYGNALSAVPEPETYALMLSGLACLTALARQRRSKAQKVS